MQKWEYLRLDVFYKEPIEGKEQGVKSIVVNYDELIFDQTFNELHNYINKLGSEGWELATEKVGGGKTHTSYYFKRPIE